MTYDFIKPTTRALIRMEDGALVVDFRYTNKADTYTNIRIEELTETRVKVQADLQVWESQYGREYFKPEELHESMQAGLLPVTRKVRRWKWLPYWQTVETGAYYHPDWYVRLKNDRPRTFISSNYTIILRK